MATFATFNFNAYEFFFFLKLVTTKQAIDLTNLKILANQTLDQQSYGQKPPPFNCFESCNGKTMVLSLHLMLKMFFFT